jgi:hypothetical protein
MRMTTEVLPTTPEQEGKQVNQEIKNMHQYITDLPPTFDVEQGNTRN